MAAAPDVVEVNLLERWEVLVGNRPILTRNHKGRALLTYLVIHPNRPHTRTQLQTLLWSNSDAKRGRTSLRKTLSQLNKVLPPSFLHLEGQIVSVGQFPFALDAARVRTHPLEYVSPAIRTMQLRNADGWDEWLHTFCTQLEQKVLATLEEVAAAALADGEYDVAIRHARHALTLDEWRERVHQLLIEGLWRSGDRLAAQAQYDRCVQILRDELGIEPSAATQTLLTRLKTTPANVPHNLPPEETFTDFVGRTAEIALVSEMLTRPKPRLLTLTGLGGIGKTRLALASARAVCTHFSNGVYWTDLTTVTPEMAVNALATSLDLQLQGLDTPLDQLINHLRGKQMLLIFDNFETVLASGAAIELVQRILTETAHVKLLVTSPERLNFRLEQVMVVDGLELATAEGDDPPPAVRLFQNAARRADLRFSDGVEEMLNVCRLVEGMPLAIEMAAAWTPLLRCAEIAAEIERDLAILRSQYHDVPERQRSLLVVFEATWRRLSAEQQQTMLRLTVFPSHFSLAAAQTIAQTDRATLDLFVSRALLSWHSAERLRFHQRVRQFLETKRNDGQLRPTHQRHSRFFADWLKEIQTRLGGHEQATLLDAIGTEADNIHAAWRRSVMAQSEERLNQMLGSFQYFLMTRGRYHEARDYLAHALQQLNMAYPLNAAQTRLLHRLHLGSANAATRLGKMKEAEQQFRFALAAAERLGDDQSYAQALSMFGYFLCETGALDEALEMLEEAVALHRHLTEPTTELHGYNTLGVVQKARGDLSAARAAYAHCLELAQQTGNERARAYVLNNIGVIHQEEGDGEKARRYYQAALPLFETLRDRRMIGMASSNMGNTFLDNEAYAEAEQWYERGLEAIADTGEQWVRGLLLLNRGHAILELGRLAEAEAALEEAQATFSRVGDDIYAARAWGKLGRLAIRRNDLSTAFHLIQRGLQLAQQQQSSPIKLDLLAEWTLLLEARGERREQIAILKGIAAHPTGSGEGTIYARSRLTRMSLDERAEVAPVDIDVKIAQLVSRAERESGSA